MTFRIGSSHPPDFYRANRNLPESGQINPRCDNKKAQTEAAVRHLTDNLSARTDALNSLQGFLHKVLREQPLDENLKKKSVQIIIEPKKPPAEMSEADYKLEFHKALLKKAGYGNLSETELTMAMNLHPVDLKNFDVENLRREDAKPGVMTIDADEFTVAAANRAAQAVLQYQTDRAEKSIEAKAKAESATNQMLIEPLKLGGNIPVRWLERILNTPKELLRQIDKGEILPGSSTAKWISGKIGEYITGKPAPKSPTMSESIEDLTGAKLPSIPDVELPRPFDYKTYKYKADGKTGEDVGATAIDIFLLKRGIIGKPNATPESLKTLGGIPEKSVAANTIFKNSWSKEKVLEIPKGKRPEPSEYLSEPYINSHLNKFDEGGGYITSKDVLDRFGRDTLGRPDGQFIMPKAELDALIKRANGDISVIEKELGIPAGAWKGKEIVRIDVPNAKNSNLRMPSGNEAGANELWLPGGKLPTGKSEAVINQVTKGNYTETSIVVKDVKK